MKKKQKQNLAIGITIGAIATGLTAYLLFRKKAKQDKPSKRAPQLDIDNPGSQAEFPTTATESEVG
ncbi:hypothetical protein SAMN05444008_110117 [Cnuella takakiae]|uniref:Uncharacterized protein n=1 Tax=Cnuella takakiae TaxID=1302690 RepID=A0A1M5D865_9BACT|nr:hypothetical protein [Cnuella takakiae]OLY94072.1 hypothetical protein BUE76_20890 [Cnuella takakiae]SHF63208.1 hypothetical protein SAMN05444008_110117 [Cnuella takakiae]